MKLLGDKILVRITKENRESIFSKEIVRNDGTKTKLFINVAATDEADERHARLFVQTGIVEAVSDQVKGVQVGDIALLDYQLCNSRSNKFYQDENGDVFWLNATTTYHDQELVAYQTRRSKRDQIVHSRGDVDELSMLLGVMRGDELIARQPYVFLENLPVTKILTTNSGIVFQETDTILTRKIIAVSKETTAMYNIKAGDTVLVDDHDIFAVEIKKDALKIDCVNDADILATEGLVKQAAANFAEMKAV